MEKFSVTMKVSKEKLANAVGSGSLAVFATPMMVALMEQAACGAAEPLLEPGQTTVGTKIDVEHVAATPLGMEVTATAVLECREGRRLDFTVTAYDEAGEIGRGTHSRVIVDAQRFQAKADGKLVS